jgi:hypothetical protein
MVKVRDMVVEKSYKVDGVTKKLTKKEEVGAGGSGNQEPVYKLTFDDATEKIKDWDDNFDEASSGGKRKTRRTRKNNKSRKGRRRSNRRRR